ncbi:methyltransferase domain-containing protein [Methylomonas paludis]|uniref:Methyltransferase domain-containing protein n=1 Tax=Methylomonas paludis TaxID=1173101 RepID=A0A975MPS6_9GAMM|nr:methyltransferase domain-containing protein [Methylomonas paludis]QWF71565.1 methyltransferase domain-containing protein [Methylomonas paludis]
MKLNLGCGPQVVDGWCNVDYSLGARLFKIPLFRTINQKFKLFNLNWHPEIYLHDLTKPFPWPDASVDVVYSSHTLEHLSKQQGRRFLAEAYRVLKPNGIIRIVVPDLQHDVNEYLQGHTKADDFIENLGVLYGSDGQGLKKLANTYFQYPHKCMYDNPRLVEILTELGFNAQVRPAFDSDIPDISAVELADRTPHSAIVEGRKN